MRPFAFSLGQAIFTKLYVTCVCAFGACVCVCTHVHMLLWYAYVYKWVCGGRGGYQVSYSITSTYALR